MRLPEGKVTNYIGEVSVSPITDTNGTFALWTSSREDSARCVAAFCNPIYKLCWMS